HAYLTPWIIIFCYENSWMFSRTDMHTGGASGVRRLRFDIVRRSTTSGETDAAICHSNGYHNQQLQPENVRGLWCSIQPRKNHRRRAHAGLCSEFYFEQ